MSSQALCSFTFLQELREEVHRYRLPSGDLSIMRICRWLDSEAWKPINEARGLKTVRELGRSFSRLLAKKGSLSTKPITRNSTGI